MPENINKKCKVCGDNCDSGRYIGKYFDAEKYNTYMSIPDPDTNTIQTQIADYLFEQLEIGKCKSKTIEVFTAGVGPGRIEIPFLYKCLNDGNSINLKLTAVDLDTGMLRAFYDNIYTRFNECIEEKEKHEVAKDASTNDESKQGIHHFSLNIKNSENKNNIEIEAFCGDLENLHKKNYYTNSHYDYIFSIFVLHAITNWEEPLYHLLRMLKPGGKIVFAEEIGDVNWLDNHFDDIEKYGIKTEKEVREEYLKGMYDEKIINLHRKFWKEYHRARKEGLGKEWAKDTKASDLGVIETCFQRMEDLGLFENSSPNKNIRWVAKEPFTFELLLNWISGEEQLYTPLNYGLGNPKNKEAVDKENIKNEIDKKRDNPWKDKYLHKILFDKEVIGDQDALAVYMKWWLNNEWLQNKDIRENINDINELLIKKIPRIEGHKFHIYTKSSEYNLEKDDRTICTILYGNTVNLHRLKERIAYEIHQISDHYKGEVPPNELIHRLFTLRDMYFRLFPFTHTIYSKWEIESAEEPSEGKLQKEVIPVLLTFPKLHREKKNTEELLKDLSLYLASYVLYAYLTLDDDKGEKDFSFTNFIFRNMPEKFPVVIRKNDGKFPYINFSQVSSGNIKALEISFPRNLIESFLKNEKLIKFKDVEGKLSIEESIVHIAKNLSQIETFIEKTKFYKLNNLECHDYLLFLAPLLYGLLNEIFDTSDFSEVEFTSTLTKEMLCKEIVDDNYKLPLNSANNTIEWLNELLMIPDFYDILNKIKSNISFSKYIIDLIDTTKEYRNKPFPTLNDGEKNNIKKLNRLLLEESYSSVTPKSSKDSGKENRKYLINKVEKCITGIEIRDRKNFIDEANKRFKDIITYNNWEENIPFDKFLLNVFCTSIIGYSTVGEWDIFAKYPGKCFKHDRKGKEKTYIREEGIGGFIVMRKKISIGDKEWDKRLEDLFKRNHEGMLFLVSGLWSRNDSILEWGRLTKETMWKHGTKAAVAAIMGRNLSHIHGSHIESGLQNNMNTFDSELSTKLSNTCNYYNKLREKLKDITFVKARNGAENNFVRLSVDLLGIEAGKKMSIYRQRKEDLIARVSTEWPGWGCGLDFYTFFIAPLKENPLLMHFINYSEGISLSKVRLEGGFCENDNIKYIKEKLKLDSESINDADMVDMAISLIGEEVNAKITADGLKPFPVRVRDADIGIHAFNSLLEGIIRNSAKHGEKQDCLEIKIIFCEDHEKVNQLAEFKNFSGSKENSYILISTNYDSTKKKNGKAEDTDNIASLSQKLGKPIIDYSTGELTPGGWGMKEIKICAAFLAGKKLLEVNSENPDYIKVGKNNKGKIWNSSERLVYVITLEKPRYVLAVIPENGKINKEECLKMGIRVVSTEEELKKAIENGHVDYDLMYIDGSLESEIDSLVKKHCSRLPQRIVKDSFHLNKCNEQSCTELVLRTYDSYLNKRLPGHKFTVYFDEGNDEGNKAGKWEENRNNLPFSFPKNITGTFQRNCNYQSFIVRHRSLEQMRLKEYDRCEDVFKTYYFQHVSYSNPFFSFLMSLDPTSFHAKLVLRQIMESTLMNILVIDERIAQGLAGKKAPDESDSFLSEKLYWMGIYVAKSLKKTNGESIDWVQDGEACRRMVEIDLENLKKETPIKFGGQEIDILFIHATRFDEIYGLVGNKFETKEAFSEHLRKKASHVIIHSGKGKTKGDMPSNAPFLEYSTLQKYLLQEPSKFYLTQIALNAKGEKDG